MKKTRFSEEQMVTILEEADEKPVPEVAKQRGVSAQRALTTRDSGSGHSCDSRRPAGDQEGTSAS